MKAAAGVGKLAQCAKQRRLVLDAVEASDVDQAWLFAGAPTHGESRWPPPQVHAERHSLRLDSRCRNQLGHRPAGARNQGGPPYHCSADDAAAPGASTAVVDVGVRDELTSCD